MKYYLDNVLKGFKCHTAYVELDGKMRQTPNFVVVDIDQDAMPELLFTYMYKGDKYIGILKRRDMKWYLVNTMPEGEYKSIGLGNLVNTVEEGKVTPKDIGKAISLEELLGHNTQPFVGFINDVAYHGVVIQPTATNIGSNQLASDDIDLINLTLQQFQSIANKKLPPVEKVNTPTAQQALGQNLVTPIMNVEETDVVVNGAVPKHPSSNSSIDNMFNSDDIDLNKLTLQEFQDIEKQKLPPVENVKTPAAQQALGQNLVTPIMNEQETDAVVNGAVPQPLTPNPIIDNELEDKEVINFTQADVTGDGMLDSIYLVGKRKVGDPTRYIENMGLRVKTRGKTLAVDFPYGNGYSPILFVGDLTTDGIPEVLVNIFSNATGGYITSYIYSFQNEVIQLLFDSKVFNEQYTGKVTFLNNYRARVTTDRPPWQYTIDISDRDSSYLSTIYDENGNLRRATEGTLLGLTSLNPIDYDVNGEFNLASVQRVIGISNLDTLGLVETYLAWRNATNRFEPFMQYLSVLGNSL
ncbi:MAG: hypothetical protein RR090_10740 [Niameybacter sp.]|uniref:hypothetical protein n=1 Tax=Niameybacter sp. TaxID=2033640 RepID=UPI002FCC1B08